jgi:hypothetical protein
VTGGLCARRRHRGRAVVAVMIVGLALLIAITEQTPSTV